MRATLLAAFICIAFLSIQPQVNGQGGVAKPQPVPSPQPTPPPKPTAPISGGVLNGKAISKPQPSYPAIARATKPSGTVTVQVLVDEDGNVISAKAVKGHKLLRQAAIDAAHEAKFSPTNVSGQRVKVSGVLTYYFEYKE
jgi:protein TonB